MATIGWIILGIMAIAGGFYTFLVVTGTDNFKGISFQLDDFYTENDALTIAALEKLRAMGKECEVIKLSKSFSEILVDGKKYYVTARTTNIGHCPVQTVQLKPLK